jgi:hypothetical protein
VVQLEAPWGVPYTLVLRDVLAGTALEGTVFDDAAGVAIGDAAPRYTGRFRPAGLLSLLNEYSMAGGWTLVVSDTAVGATGELLRWDIGFNGCDYGAEGEGEGEGEGDSEPYHSSDYRAPWWQIDLNELLRIIQFYNSGAFHCAPVTEDGYAPGPGMQDCPAHHSDYAPENWKIELSELLRVVQFYNSGGYHPCLGSEDGYCPGQAAGARQG